MTKIFIDGSAGTTGLRIRERLAGREGLDILALPEELRKDPEARRVALNSADIAKDRDIEFIDDPEIKKKKATSDKYVRIYRNITSQNKAFASNVSALSDVEDECVRFAELFFGDIVL